MTLILLSPDASPVEHRGFFNKSKSTCVDIQENISKRSLLYGRRIAAGKGKVVFYHRQRKFFCFEMESFFEENVSNFPFIRTHCKNLWTFLRNLPIFLHSPSRFWGKGSVSSFATPCTVLSRPSPRAFADTRLRIAHSASSKSLPSPFTFTPNSLYSCGL